MINISTLPSAATQGIIFDLVTELPYNKSRFSHFTFVRKPTAKFRLVCGMIRWECQSSRGNSRRMLLWSQGFAVQHWYTSSLTTQRLILESR